MCVCVCVRLCVQWQKDFVFENRKVKLKWLATAALRTDQLASANRKANGQRATWAIKYIKKQKRRRRNKINVARM